MRKWRKFLIVPTLLVLIPIGVRCFAPQHRPANEPQYQGRYLSEWLSDPRVFFPDVEFVDEAGKEAVLAIGTNGLPYYLNWLCYEPSETRMTLREKLPQWIKRHHAVSNWLSDPAGWRAGYGYRGFEILGTNGVSAIPELTVMLNQTNKPYLSARALGVLSKIGPQAIPVLKSALDNTNRTDRWKIAAMLRYMGNNGYSNTCGPILVESLSDHDPEVREQVAKALERWSPHLLTNLPAN
ncbi:MAG TPA: HEAT repeat domain-containing protein [Verrucomicrobiae bacterium]|nr:HEAT repeat domain-containing protein [Verrucomicrobiae bacterium]